MTPVTRSSRTPGHVTPEVDRTVKDLLGITPLTGRIDAVQATHKSGDPHALSGALADLASGLLYQVEVITGAIHDTIVNNPELASKALITRLREAHDQVNTTADHEESLRPEPAALSSLRGNLTRRRRELGDAFSVTRRRRELLEVISVTAAREPTHHELEVLASAAMSLAHHAHEIGAHTVAVSQPKAMSSEFASDLRSQFARSAARMDPMVGRVHRLLDDADLTINRALGRGSAHGHSISKQRVVGR